MNVKQKNPTIGILNLDANIPMYHEALRYLSFALSKREVEVVRLGCDSVLQRCVNINSQPEIVRCNELDTKKKSICTVCRSRQNQIVNRRHFTVSAELDKLNSDQEEFLKNVENTLKQDPRAVKIIDFTYRDIELCKIAFYDFSMSGKMSHLSLLNDEEITRLAQHIHDSLLLFNFFERVGRFDKFTKIVYVNGNYSNNTLARCALKNASGEFLSLEFQFSSFKAWNRIFFERDRLELMPKWPAIRSLESTYKLKRSDLKAALRVMENRFIGNDFNSYTKPGAKSAFAQFDAFRNRYKTLITYFSCSTDEMYSHIVTHNTKIDDTFYANQYDLIQDFINNAKSDIGYVIRVHPRLAPNKRDRVVSREITEINKYLDMARTRDNFFVIDAGNPLSSYYILLKSDLVLVAWSTIAMEAMVAGKPAFALFPADCCFPMNELCRQPSGIDEYRRILRGEIPPSAYTIDDSRLMNWIAMVYNALGKPIPSPRGSGQTLHGRIYNFLYNRLTKFDWTYDLLMTPLAFFFSDAVDALLHQGMPVPERSESQDDNRGGLAELLVFRKKIRDIVLR